MPLLDLRTASSHTRQSLEAIRWERTCSAPVPILHGLEFFEGAYPCTLSFNVFVIYHIFCLYTPSFIDILAHLNSTNKRRYALLLKKKSHEAIWW